MSHLNINGVDKPLDHVYVNTGSVVKEAWEARDKNDHLLWGRADTFTGTSSISVRGYGLPVKSWEIDGNSQQTGTPTPDNPIMPEFVGVRTGNLFDPNSTRYHMGKGTNNRIGVVANGAMFYIEADADMTYTVKVHTSDATFVRLYLSDAPIVDGVAETFSVISESETVENPEVSITNTNHAYLWIQTGGTWYTEHGGSSIMLNTGSTALPHEPYGWKVPFTSANQTVSVYLGQVQTVRRVKKLVLTGQEDWTYSYSGNKKRVFVIGFDRAQIATSLCSHFVNTDYVSYPDSGKFAINTTSTIQTIIFGVTDMAITNATDWSTYLAQQYANGTPVTVWYVLATPEAGIVNEPIAKIGTYADTLTSEQAGIAIPTTDGSTTISVDTALSPSRFEIKVHAKPIHYGFKIDKAVSDPSNAVIYTHDAVTMTPAGMDFTNGVFDYGSWENVWFIKNARPVMLNFDGTEAYDLDPNDYSKKLDGTPSDIADSTKNMNAMIAFPTVWIKRTDDANYNYIEISDRQLDSDFHAYAHEDANGVVQPYIYLPIYKGSIVDGKLRSISGVKPQSGTIAQQEVDAASALGTGWQIWDYTSKEMLCDLLTLISKSLDTQGKFGQGHSTGGSSASDFLNCGTLNEKGKFFGYSATTSQVKCFGMEALWAERWDRELGLILDAGIYKIKEHPAYNLTGEGYTAISTSVAKCPTSNNYIKTEVSTQFGSLPTVVGGTQSTYYCDYFYQNQSDVRVAVRGGHCNLGAYAGLRCVRVNSAASGSLWGLGASPVYKPI